MLRFSLRGLIVLVSLAAFYFALRTSYVERADDMVDGIQRAHVSAIVFAVAAVGIDLFRRLRASFLRSLVIGCFAALAVSSPIALTIVEGFQSHGYWTWSQDFPHFLLFLGVDAVFGACVGLVLATIARGSLLLFGPTKRSPATPISIHVRDLP